MEEKNLGYVRVWRKIQNNPLWLLEPFTKGQAWVDLIMLANHKAGNINIRGNIIEIKRGQLGWSEDKLGERWKWSRGKVKRYINYLKTIHQIEQQKSYVISLITILNYNLYQSDSTENDTSDSTTDGHQTVQQTDTNNNGNNVKNDNNDRGVKIDTPLSCVKSPHKEILEYFVSSLKEKKGFEPEMNFAKDGSLLKKQLARRTPAELKRLIDWFIKSEDAERLGYSLSTCLSAYIINKWLAIEHKQSWQYAN